MRSSVCIPAFAALVAITCHPAPQPVDGASRCAPEAWATPESLWAGPLVAASAHPSSVSGNVDATLVLGREASSPDRPAADTMFAGVLLPSASSEPIPIRRPQGARFFINPIAAIDALGVPHVLWAEPGVTLHGENAVSSSRPRSVWSASLRSGKWTTPNRVAVADWLTWSESGQSPAVQAADGTIQFVVPAWSKRIGLLHLTLTPNGWIAGHIPLAMPAAYAVLASRGEDLLLAYVSPVQGARDLNSLWFTRSTDSGRTWRPSVLVSRSGEKGAGPPMIVSIENSIHLIWGQNLSGGLTTEVLRHAESNDDGMTWGAHADLPVPQFFMSYGAFADPRGVIQVFFSSFVGGRLALQRAQWCGSTWQSPDIVPVPGLGLGSATVHRTGRGTLDVFASGEMKSGAGDWTAMWMRIRSR